MFRPTAQAARLLLPRPSLAGCLFAAVARDTRGLDLVAAERLNFFPASPLCAVSLFFEGRSLVVDPDNLDPDAAGRALPTIFVSGPQRRPLTSWNPGPVHALTIGFYPEAWPSLLRGDISDAVDRNLDLPDAARDAFAAICHDAHATGDAVAAFDLFQNRLEPIWRNARPAAPAAARLLGDWSRALALRAATSGPGRSARQVQRRVRAWTGQALRDLNVYARTERLFAQSQAAKKGGAFDLAKLAVEAGFADQSHMGRAVRRVTGLSPSRLGAAIDTDEAFWCYRLLGARF